MLVIILYRILVLFLLSLSRNHHYHHHFIMIYSKTWDFSSLSTRTESGSSKGKESVKTKTQNRLFVMKVSQADLSLMLFCCRKRQGCNSGCPRNSRDDDMNEWVCEWKGVGAVLIMVFLHWGCGYVVCSVFAACYIEVPIAQFPNSLAVHVLPFVKILWGFSSCWLNDCMIQYAQFCCFIMCPFYCKIVINGLDIFHKTRSLVRKSIVSESDKWKQTFYMSPVLYIVGFLKCIVWIGVSIHVCINHVLLIRWK